MMICQICAPHLLRRKHQYVGNESHGRAEAKAKAHTKLTMAGHVNLSLTDYLGQVMHGPCALDGLFERIHILLSKLPFRVLLSNLLCGPSWLAARRSFLSELSVTYSIATGGCLACPVNL